MFPTFMSGSKGYRDMKEIVNIAIKGYKVFSRNEYTYMNNVSRINIIIGKNNSGKTSLLDIIGLSRL